jgi:Flp pilus assembly protein TadD
MPVVRAGIVAAFLLVAAMAQAQESAYQQVNRLLQAGEVSQAGQKVDEHLARQPRDPQMRMLRGVIQTQQGQDEQALETFTSITRDYPELPEPYNNLAVLHAAANRLDQAREALEMAVRLNPDYATAQQNLGDVFTRLATRAYGNALRIEPGNDSLRARIKALETVLSEHPKW